MTNPTEPTDPRSPGNFPANPPSAPPTAPPSALPDADIQPVDVDLDAPGHSVEMVEKSPSMAGRLGLVAAAVVVLGAAVFAVTTALSGASGPDSPVEAVEQFFQAMDDDDLIGMTEVMLPSERESLIGPSLDLLAELQRLDVVDADFDPEAVEGFDFQVDGIEVVAADLGDGVARARVTAGTIRFTGNANQLPVGEYLLDQSGEDLPNEPIDEQIVDFDDEDVEIVVVEEDGSWFVSMWYTVAEAARAETDLPAPDFGNGVIPVGADSPGGAVEAMISEAVDLDLEGVIAALDPSEFRALHDYAPLFLDDAEDAVDSFRTEAEANGVTWQVDRVDTRNFEVRGRTVVAVEGFAASATIENEIYSIEWADDCVTLVTPGETEQICGDELNEQFGADYGAETFFGEDVQTGVTVVERDGQWFVSGFPTVMGLYVDLLSALDQDDLDRMGDEFLSGIEGGLSSGPDLFDELGGFGGQTEFDEVEDAIGSGDEEAIDDLVDDLDGEDVEYVEIEVSEIDRALVLPEVDVYGLDPEFFFGFTTDLVPAASTSGFNEDFESITLHRFPEGSNAQLIADLEADSFYEPTTIEGLPDGAVAFEFAEVDIMVVYGDLVISTWIDDSEDLLVRQVQFLAES